MISMRALQARPGASPTGPWASQGRSLKPRLSSSKVRWARFRGETKLWGTGQDESCTQKDELSRGADMWVSLLGTMSLSLPTRALPVALTLFSPSAVRGMSVTPVCLPLRDHSVSPWRAMKTRGVDMVGLSGCKCRGTAGAHKAVKNSSSE